MINCDAVQLYKGFDIGSAKPTLEQRREVTHHLFDVASWHEDFDASTYGQQAREVICRIAAGGRLLLWWEEVVFICVITKHHFHDLPHDPRVRLKFTQRSASELYLELKTKDPQRAGEIHPNDHFRLARALELIEITGKTVSDLYSKKLK